MANTTISPNMNLPIPVVSTDTGPDWSNNVNASLNIIDSHNHSNGEGVLITPSGLNINSDLTFNNNNGTNFRSARFTPQTSLLSGTADIGCLYESGVDLYYNDGNGNQVRITQGGSVTGSTGTISGLPSGTASAAYSAGNFTFSSATSTPANMSVGPVAIGLVVANSKTVTLSPTTGQPTNYTLYFPSAAPSANQILVSDGSGNLTWIGSFIAGGSFTGTFTGVSGSITSTFYYSMANNIVTISLGQTDILMTKSGNGTIGLTGVPSSILPSSSTLNAMAAFSVNNGGTYVPCLCSITSSGFTFFADLAGNQFIGAQSCVYLGTAFSYLLRS